MPMMRKREKGVGEEVGAKNVHTAGQRKNSRSAFQKTPYVSIYGDCFMFKK